MMIIYMPIKAKNPRTTHPKVDTLVLALNMKTGAWASTLPYHPAQFSPMAMPRPINGEFALTQTARPQTGYIVQEKNSRKRLDSSICQWN